MPTRSRLDQALHASKQPKVNGLGLKTSYVCTDQKNSVFSIKYNEYGSLAIGLGDGTIQFRDENHKLITSTKALDGDIPVMSVRWIKKNGIWAAMASGTIMECSFGTNDEIYIRRLFKEIVEINCLDISNSNQAVTGGNDGFIRVYDIKSEQIMRETSKHTSRIFSVHWKDDSTIISGGWDDMVKIWDIRMGGMNAGCLSGPHICGDSIDTFDYFVLTGSWSRQGALQLWDARFLKTPAITFYLDGGEKGEYLYGAKLLPSENTAIAAGSGTCGAHLVDLMSGRVVGFVPFGNRSVQTLDCFCEDIVMAGCGENVRVCSLLR